VKERKEKRGGNKRRKMDNDWKTKNKKNGAKNMFWP
jgi:hypothetical protein